MPTPKALREIRRTVQEEEIVVGAAVRRKGRLERRCQGSIRGGSECGAAASPGVLCQITEDHNKGSFSVFASAAFAAAMEAGSLR